jgi:NitT/TauT family transport system substrate-binding protein
MTDARWKSFYDAAAAVGLYPNDLDYKKAYTVQFVGKKHGMAAAK